MPTYPKDDKGNVRVDFVWGNFPIQPDELRTGGGHSVAPNDEGNKGWSGYSTQDSSTLPSSNAAYLSVGDQSQNVYWGDPSTREVAVPNTNNIATTGWSNFPGYIPNYAGDGDTVLEAVVPDVIGLKSSAVHDALNATGFAFVSTNTYDGATVINDGKAKSSSPAAGATPDAGSNVTVTFFQAPTVPDLAGLNLSEVGAALSAVNLIGNNTLSTDGATSGNNGTVKSQAIAAGTKVDDGTTINYVLYNYVVPTHPIAGISVNSFPGHDALTGDNAYMFLLGRTTKPAVNDVIVISGNSNTSLNQHWLVNVVEDNDSYNSGGTVVTMAAQDSGPSSVNTNSGGTWQLS